MASPQEKAQVVLWYAEHKYVVIVQRMFRTVYKRNPPQAKSIKKWHETFLETGSVQKRSGGDRRSLSDARVEEVREAFVRRPRQSIRQAASELSLPRSTIHNVLHRKLRMHAYKMQIVQKLQPNDGPQRAAFAVEMLSRTENEHDFLNRIFFSDEATFHVSNIVNKHNCRIWGSENPHSVHELERSSPKINVWCALSHDTVIGPFFFAEESVTANIYLDMLQIYAIPQMQHLQPTVIFQQDGAPPHWGKHVRAFLDAAFPTRWIGRGGPIAWPPRSPDVTPLDFFFWGYVKDKVYSRNIRDIEDLRASITAAIANVTPEILHRTWLELDYRLDILRATKGAHVEVW